jgi:hypothetical protein
LRSDLIRGSGLATYQAGTDSGQEKIVTLVVARCEKGRIAIAADTLVWAPGGPLPLTSGVVNSCCLPGYICVSFNNSPDLAANAFAKFADSHPRGANFETTVTFFEVSSGAANNDYIIAFGKSPRLVTIRDGWRRSGLSKTHWIGDKDAYEKFREYEHRKRERYEHGRAVNAALFADEMAGSPASELHGVMRNVVQDRELSTVGGFVTVLSNRDIGFRYSVYSDVLLDWPKDLADGRTLQLTDKFHLSASSENDRFSVSQISSGYYNMNIVAFYLLKGQLLVAFHGVNNGIANRCSVFPRVEPSQISSTLNEKLGFNFGALCIVMSSREGVSHHAPMSNPEHGISMSLYCEANTMPNVS